MNATGAARMLVPLVGTPGGSPRSKYEPNVPLDDANPRTRSVLPLVECVDFTKTACRPVPPQSTHATAPAEPTIGFPVTMEPPIEAVGRPRSENWMVGPD